MKKIRLGRKITFYLLIGMFLIGLLYCMALLIIEQASQNSITTLLIFCTAVFILFFISLFEPDWLWFMELTDNQIKVKTPILNVGSYNRQGLHVKYAIKGYRGVVGIGLTHPCLVIGEITTDTIYFKDSYFSRISKFVYAGYFLVVLDEKKLETILSWYKEEIILPPKQEFENFSTKKIEKFYEIIKNHNESIQKD